MHLYSLCQTWLNLKTHTVSETENRTSCLTTVVRSGGGGYPHLLLRCTASLLLPVDAQWQGMRSAMAVQWTTAGGQKAHKQTDN